MSTTLSKGYKKPDNLDPGNVWFPDLADNIVRVNGHTHDGTNSEKLTSRSISFVQETILAANFAVDGDRLRAQQNLPAGLNTDDILFTFRDPTTKDRIYCDIEKINSTSYYIYAMVAQDIEAVYG